MYIGIKSGYSLHFYFRQLYSQKNNDDDDDDDEYEDEDEDEDESYDWYADCISYYNQIRLQIDKYFSSRIKSSIIFL